MRIDVRHFLRIYVNALLRLNAKAHNKGRAERRPFVGHFGGQMSPDDLRDCASTPRDPDTTWHIAGGFAWAWAALCQAVIAQRRIAAEPGEGLLRRREQRQLPKAALGEAADHPQGSWPGAATPPPEAALATPLLRRYA